MDARLDSPFESWGNFSETMTDPPVVPGRLTYDPRDGIALELVGPPPGSSLQALMELPCLPTLYGRLVNGTPVTLVDCTIANTQIGAGAVGLPTAIRPAKLLVGGHVDDLDQLNVKRYTVEFSSLANWTCASPIKSDWPTTDGKRIGVDITFRFPDPIEIELSERNFDLKIAHNFKASDSHVSYSIRWHAHVRISAHDSMLFKEIPEVAWQCQNLLSLLIGDHLSVKSITIKPAEPFSAGTTESPLQLIYQQIGKHDRPDLRPDQMLLPYSLIEEQFPQIVAEWFARSEQAVLASNVFFGSQLHESPGLEARFLAATQAAESYHRSLGTGVYMEKGEYQAAIAEFLSQIPEAIQGDQRVSLKSRLEWGYEYSFFKRLRDLLKRLPADVQSRIAGQGNASKFLAKVKDTRNYFTHLDHTSEQNALKGTEAFVACERLRILVVANLLHDLGIKDQILLSVLERNREFRHWLAQDLPL
ncbi:MAG: hypothetical protein IH986_08815, partial [Planctomycetes bacterium]|nr:hypothetical protein [Planctomycetota bacterium]